MVALLALILAFAPPVPDASPQPPATQSASDIPEIGRVRAISPACGAMRDLVIPSFKAAKEADGRFENVSKNLPEYVRAIADDSKYNPEPAAVREFRLAKLAMDNTKMLQNAKVIADALGDRRLAGTSDPAVIAERQQLQSLYDYQITRASELNQFVMREENTVALLGVGGDGGAFRGRNGNQAQATPEPRQTSTPMGMPKLNGRIGFADAASIRDWTGQITAAVKGNEEVAARAFFSIAKSCQAK
jgi:hypothetical protein